MGAACSNERSKPGPYDPALGVAAVRKSEVEERVKCKVSEESATKPAVTTEHLHEKHGDEEFLEHDKNSLINLEVNATHKSEDRGVTQIDPPVEAEGHERVEEKESGGYDKSGAPTVQTELVEHDVKNKLLSPETEETTHKSEDESVVQTDLPAETNNHVECEKENDEHDEGKVHVETEQVSKLEEELVVESHVVRENVVQDESVDVQNLGTKENNESGEGHAMPVEPLVESTNVANTQSPEHDEVVLHNLDGEGGHKLDSEHVKHVESQLEAESHAQEAEKVSKTESPVEHEVQSES